MKITEGILEISADMKHNSHCCDCFGNLDWEVHNPGELDMECWIAFCKCNNHQRMWILRATAFEITSINNN